jgi:hypothetical protein
LRGIEKKREGDGAAHRSRGAGFVELVQRSYHSWRLHHVAVV